MADPEINLSIIVPAYNEAKRIGKCLLDLVEFAENTPHEVEILVVDDHSSDNTCGIVKRFKEEHPDFPLFLLKTPLNRKGKGGAVNLGMLEARGEFRLFTDVDLSTPISEVRRLLFWAEQGYSLVFGSRSLPGSDVRVPQPLHRRLAGAVMRNLTNVLIIRGVRDTQCGFKLFSKKAAIEIFSRQRVWGWCFDLEILVLADLMGHSFREVAVIWVDSSESKVHFFRDTAKMFWGIFAIAFRLRLLKRIPDPGDLQA